MGITVCENVPESEPSGLADSVKGYYSVRTDSSGNSERAPRTADFPCADSRCENFDY
jgi:hypothetical protein